MQHSTALALSLAALIPATLAPAAADAREVSLSTTLTNYGGEGAYLAIYVTDAAGAYQGTLWLAGGKSKWWPHLADWHRATGGAVPDGVTGASVGAGRTLDVTVELADALFDAGYQIRIDSSVEDMGDAPADVVAELTSAGAGKPVPGNGYVQSLTYR